MSLRAEAVSNEKLKSTTMLRQEGHEHVSLCVEIVSHEKWKSTAMLRQEGRVQLSM